MIYPNSWYANFNDYQGKEKRLLKEEDLGLKMTIESIDPNLASKLSFTWDIVELTPRKVMFQVTFNEPSLVSMSG